MKVLYITNVEAPYRVALFNKLGEKCDLDVVFYGSKKNKEYKNRNTSWFDKNKNNYNILETKNISIFGNDISFDIIKILKNNRYNIIVVGDYSSLTSIIAMWYMKKNKIKFILSTDGGFPSYNENKIKKIIKTKIISMADYYLSTGANGNEYLKYYGANPEKIYHYTFSSFQIQDMPKRLLNENEKNQMKEKLKIKEKNVITFIGSIIPDKGIDILLKSLKNLKQNTGVYIIGGKITKEYSDIIEKEKIKNIYFIDFVNKKEIIKYLSITDIFAFPTRHDVWGFVVTEALSYGVPVITTNVCGAGVDLIKDGYNGYLIDNEDVDALGNKIDYLLKNDKIRQEISEHAFYDMKDFTIEKETIEHLELFEKIEKENVI